MSQFLKRAGVAALVGATSLALSGPVAAEAVTAPPRVVSSTPLRAATFNGPVHAIAVARGVVYVGGEFTRARDASGGFSRHNVAALDASTGQLLPWNPGTDGEVDAIAAGSRRVYLGGEFEHVAGHPRRHLAALRSTATAQLVPHWRNDAIDGYVKALGLGKRGLYVGGSFKYINTVRRNRLALVKPDGTLDPRWRPAADDTVRALAVGTGGVFIGGVFQAVNGQRSAGHLAAIGPVTGRLLTGFNPDIRISVNGIALRPHLVLAAADGKGGHLRVFGPLGAQRFQVSTDGALNDVTSIGRTIYIAGHMDHVCPVATDGPCPSGMKPRGKLAAVSLQGRLRAWNPDANSIVGALALASSAGRLFAGGAWTTLNGGAIHRPHFARFG